MYWHNELLLLLIIKQFPRKLIEYLNKSGYNNNDKVKIFKYYETLANDIKLTFILF